MSPKRKQSKTPDDENKSVKKSKSNETVTNSTSSSSSSSSSSSTALPTPSVTDNTTTPKRIIPIHQPIMPTATIEFVNEKDAMVQKLQKQLTCVICTNFVWEGYTPSCQHAVMCKLCCMRLYANKTNDTQKPKPNLKKLIPCTICKEPYRFREYQSLQIRNPVVHGFLADIDIYCPFYHNLGCDWKGKYTDGVRHMSSCKCATQQCKVCELWVTSDRMAEHSKQCFPKIVCNFCGDLFLPTTKEEALNHKKQHKNVCPKVMVTCPSLSCMARMQRQDEPNHLRYCSYALNYFCPCDSAHYSTEDDKKNNIAEIQIADRCNKGQTVAKRYCLVTLRNHLLNDHIPELVESEYDAVLTKSKLYWIYFKSHQQAVALCSQYHIMTPNYSLECESRLCYKCQTPFDEDEGSYHCNKCNTFYCIECVQNGNDAYEPEQPVTIESTNDGISSSHEQETIYRIGELLDNIALPPLSLPDPNSISLSSPSSSLSLSSSSSSSSFSSSSTETQPH